MLLWLRIPSGKFQQHSGDGSPSSLLSLLCSGRSWTGCWLPPPAVTLHIHPASGMDSRGKLELGSASFPTPWPEGLCSCAALAEGGRRRLRGGAVSRCPGLSTAFLARAAQGGAGSRLPAALSLLAQLSPALLPGAPFLVAGEGSLVGMCPLPCRSTGGCRVSVVPRGWISRVRSSACSQVSIWGSQRCPQSPCPPADSGCDTVILSDSFQLSSLLF